MKSVIILFIVLAAGIFYVWPYVGRQKACYEHAQTAIEDIQYNIVAKFWSGEMVCESKVAVLEQLESCLKQATSSGQFITQTYPIIDGAMSVVRPLSKGIFTLKSEHNLECKQQKYQV